jgi:hypothetical protein
MARACELFAMDVENRSELVMEDRGVTKGETFKHKRYMSPHLTDCRSSLAGSRSSERLEASALCACAQIPVLTLLLACGRGEKRGFKHSQLRPHDVQTAIDSTDYCDFLIDLVHPPTSEA